jgi:hypothetical protein
MKEFITKNEMPSVLTDDDGMVKGKLIARINNVKIASNLANAISVVQYFVQVELPADETFPEPMYQHILLNQKTINITKLELEGMTSLYDNDELETFVAEKVLVNAFGLKRTDWEVK